jgi:hypothetical protein
MDFETRFVAFVAAAQEVHDAAPRGASAALESLRRHEEDPTRPAWTAEFLVEALRALPASHSATRWPVHDFGGHQDPRSVE